MSVVRDMGRTANRARFWFWPTILMVLLLINGAGCGTESHHRVLTFLFDGVPALPDSSGAGAEQKSAEELRAERLKSKDELRRAEAAKMLETMHPPYADQECSACHNFSNDKGQSSGGLAVLDFSEDSAKGFLNLPADELCFQCHDDKSEEYADANELVIHPPVADGECLECHNPHRSPNPHLLLEEDIRALCFNCHDESIAEGEDDHPELDATETCTDCHDPHLSSEEFLFK